MKIFAQHERDDLVTELEAEQELQLNEELGFSVFELYLAGITAFKTEEGWHYTLKADWE
jgi:hypothetical protein